MQSKQGVTPSSLGYLVDCLKSVYNYYSTVSRFFQVNNSIIAVVIDIFKNCRYNRKTTQIKRLSREKANFTVI